jgi:hypothetical protein
VSTQPISDERPLNKRLRDEASEWDVDESVIHLFVEAADAIEHMAAALVAVRAERDALAELLRYEPHQRDGNFVDFTFHVDTLAAVLKTEAGGGKAASSGGGA